MAGKGKSGGAKDAPPGIDTSKWPATAIAMKPIDDLLPYARNSRTHSPEQVGQIAASIKEWGFTNPVLIDEAGTIIAGHGRVMAARKLGLPEVPTMTAAGWTDGQKRAYVIADNKLALNAGWDNEALKVELGELGEVGFDIGLTGFDDSELSDLLGGGVDVSADTTDESRGKSGEFLRFGKNKIAIAEDELLGLQSLMERYAQEFGLTTGFARWLVEGSHVG